MDKLYRACTVLETPDITAFFECTEQTVWGVTGFCTQRRTKLVVRWSDPALDEAILDNLKASGLLDGEADHDAPSPEVASAIERLPVALKTALLKLQMVRKCE